MSTTDPRIDAVESFVPYLVIFGWDSHAYSDRPTWAEPLYDQVRGHLASPLNLVEAAAVIRLLDDHEREFAMSGCFACADIHERRTKFTYRTVLANFVAVCREVMNPVPNLPHVNALADTAFELSRGKWPPRQWAEACRCRLFRKYGLLVFTRLDRRRFRESADERKLFPSLYRGRRLLESLESVR